MRGTLAGGLLTLIACGDGSPDLAARECEGHSFCASPDPLPEGFSESEVVRLPPEVEEQAPDEVTDEWAAWAPLTCDLLVPRWGTENLAIEARLPSNSVGEQVEVRYCGYFVTRSGKLRYFDRNCIEVGVVNTGRPVYCREWNTSPNGTESLSGYAWLFAKKEQPESSSLHPEYGMPLQCEHSRSGESELESSDVYEARARVPGGGLVEVTWCGRSEHYDGELLLGSDDQEDCTTTIPRYIDWFDERCRDERTYTEAGRELYGYEFSSWRGSFERIYLRVLSGVGQSFVPSQLIICDDDFDPETHQSTPWGWIDEACLSYGRADRRDPRCLEWFDGWEDLGCYDSQHWSGAVMSQSIYEVWLGHYWPDYPSLRGPTLSSKGR